jgi:hypothetical protein
MILRDQEHEDRMRKVTGVVVMAAFALLGSVATSSAEGCATTLLNCYQEAAKIDSFWYRWAAGIDCELNFIECARVKIIGG